MTPRLFVVVRGDLPDEGPRAAQAMHAAIDFCMTRPIEALSWWQRSNTVVVLEARDEEHLCELAARAFAADVDVQEFREPDLGESLTAIALVPSAMAERVCRDLPRLGARSSAGQSRAL